jgi:epoxyqueuosine reductase
MFKKAGIYLLLAAALASCKSRTKEPVSTLIKVDPKEWVDEHTLSNADSVQVKHLHLDIGVDMDRKQISGSATWTIANDHGKKELVLDTYELTIDSAVVDGVKVEYKLDGMITYLGRALHVPIAAGSKSVVIYYKTGPGAKALQWLSPQQTHDKKFPFLYTQSEAIYARSWIPCPDGPGIRFTYSARVKVPKGLLALMSAENSDVVNDSGIYRFRMQQPIPAYLMALAVGDLEFRGIDDRTGVYAEKGMIDKARWEFENVGRMVGTAEQLYGPYRWGRYDVLVCPPGFPIGGMENPRLTFCTPSIIAGDRSLVSLIAHELAHSWSGNLVTNATWNDFWLNEGFTNYFERRIMEQMMGESYSDMLWELGYQDLESTVTHFGPKSRETWLKKGYQGKMQYMENHFDLRTDPRKLVPGARSVITLLLNYYPTEQQQEHAPKIAKYARGTDYHYVIREKLNKLLEYINTHIGAVNGRGFVDSAPVLERSWAVRSGLGWIGKNGNMLTRHSGSFFFIATLITDLDLVADAPFTTSHCGTCTRCIDECPTQAIVAPGEVDGSKCISYLTIELKDALLPADLQPKMDGWLFGCDVCQDVCPWNRFSKPHSEPNFTPIPEILNLSLREWEDMSEETFNKVFRKSPMKISTWRGIQRNIGALRLLYPE